MYDFCFSPIYAALLALGQCQACCRCAGVLGPLADSPSLAAGGIAGWASKGRSVCVSDVSTAFWLSPQLCFRARWTPNRTSSSQDTAMRLAAHMGLRARSSTHRAAATLTVPLVSKHVVSCHDAFVHVVSRAAEH